MENTFRFLNLPPETPALRILGVIPARYASTRFDGKPLALIAGKPMIQHVYEQASQAKLDDLIVATDDQRVMQAVGNFGGRALMTRRDHETGSSRCAEVAAGYFSAGENGIVINIQGDEPLVPPENIDRIRDMLTMDGGISIATLCIPTSDPRELASPDVVKVVMTLTGRALYFSRSPIPYHHDSRNTDGAYRHIGIYGFRWPELSTLAELKPTAAERAERLEQLRWLQHGIPIGIAETDKYSLSVDVPDDIGRVEARMRSG